MKIFCPKCRWIPQPQDRRACEPSCEFVWNTFDTAGVSPQCGKPWEDTRCLARLAWSHHADRYHDLVPDEERQPETQPLVAKVQ